ncbi:halocyanin precursor-like protein [Haloferax elongans ATCC BAA-1513]|uniref:Halocyanin-like protein n=1 Tax=Haloferax elongans ATCC BAA-1513 TaxID=1230453 RepID=M0HT43_HALEO|nr:plastocyanin/azurin family copper-binding protein [Haloferax elongans]ELZ87646.1 halocyanin precursor-like protein [Haloferax elongans ATCC BAA-1513]
MTIVSPTSRRRLLSTTGGVLVAGVLGGCLGGSKPGSDGSAPETLDSGLPSRVEVTMTSRPTPKFEPRLAHVAVGGTVVWTLHSGDHDSTAYHPDTYGPDRIPPGTEPWASDTMSSVGETFEQTFDTPGVYDYVDTQAVCTAHEQIGNVGRVVVGWPELDPETQPALRPPQSELPRIARTRIEELNDQTHSLLADEGTTTTEES